MEFRHFVVVAQVIRDEPRVSVAFFHANARENPQHQKS
jgi:hypothetical protein